MSHSVDSHDSFANRESQVRECVPLGDTSIINYYVYFLCFEQGLASLIYLLWLALIKLEHHDAIWISTELATLHLYPLELLDSPCCDDHLLCFALH